MASNENGDLSSRAELVENWEDFLNKYLSICNDDIYDRTDNPDGYINLGTAINNMCGDMVLPRLKSRDIWTCDTSMLQYQEGYGIPRLRKALSAVMTKFFGTHEPVNPDDLYCLPGVTSCLDLIAHCLADSGDVFLAPTPLYGGIYTNFMQRSHVEIFPIPIIAHDNTESFPILTIEKVRAAYESAITQKQVVRGIFLINPSNPLGDIYSPQLLMDILSFCHEHKLHAIVDEVYALSVFHGEPEFYSILRLPNLPDRNKTHVLYGISKDFCAAGLRVGAIHTRNKPLQRCLKQLSFLLDIPFPIMDMTARFLEDLEWCEMYISINKDRLTEKSKSCAKRLKKMGLNVRNSGGCFFLWVDFRPIIGSKSFDQEMDFFNYLMEKAHLYIIPGKELFSTQPGWFRVTFTGYPDHVEAGMDRLENAVKSYTRLES